MTHPFLSDEWIAAARDLRAAQAGATAESAIPTVRVNLTITGVPFGEGTVTSHVDTSAGVPELELGHLDEPDVSLTTDYETAKSIFVLQDPTAGMQAFMSGKVVVQGDLMKLMGLNAAMIADPHAAAVADSIKAITS